MQSVPSFCNSLCNLSNSHLSSLEACRPRLLAANLSAGDVFDSNTMPLLLSAQHRVIVTFISEYSPKVLPVQLLMGTHSQSLERIILSSLFSWPPQGHSTSSKKKNLQHSVCEACSRCCVPTPYGNRCCAE